MQSTTATSTQTSRNQSGNKSKHQQHRIATSSSMSMTSIMTTTPAHTNSYQPGSSANIPAYGSLISNPSWLTASSYANNGNGGGNNEDQVVTKATKVPTSVQERLIQELLLKSQQQLQQQPQQQPQQQQPQQQPQQQQQPRAALCSSSNNNSQDSSSPITSAPVQVQQLQASAPAPTSTSSSLSSPPLLQPRVLPQRQQQQQQHLLTPWEASIIYALRQQKQLQAVTELQAVTDAVTDAARNHLATTATATATATATTTSAPALHAAPASAVSSISAPYQQVQSREQDTPLSEEEKELLNIPLLSLEELDKAAAGAACFASTDENEPRENDVLLGRGGMTNLHLGNKKFRQVVQNRQELYRKVPKFDKIWIAQNVVAKIQEANGRFLRLDDNKKVWVEVSRKKAIEKASQALREREREGGRSRPPRCLRSAGPSQFQKAKWKKNKKTSTTGGQVDKKGIETVEAIGEQGCYHNK